MIAVTKDGYWGPCIVCGGKLRPLLDAVNNDSKFN